MKSGVVTYDFFPLIGGIGRHTYSMYCELKEKDLVFFSPADNSLSGHVPIKFWPIRFIKQVGVSIWLHLNVDRIISQYHLDRLNVHSGAGGVLLARRLPIPVVITCHHTYWQQYTFIKSQFWKRIFLPFEKRTYRLADRIICVSEDTRKVLVERYRIPEGKLSLVHFAIDEERFYRDETIPKRENSLVYIGRIDKRKGIEFLIRSMPLVREQIPGVRLLVGGKGSYLEKMKALVQKLGLQENVTFLGFVPDEQLNTLYNQAQCAVVPSIFEGFGITVVEALAAGTRVVGTDVDGIRETLKGGEYGRLAPYGDCRALAQAIVAELREPRQAPPLRPEFRMEQFREGYLRELTQ